MKRTELSSTSSVTEPNGDIELDLLCQQRFVLSFNRNEYLELSVCEGLWNSDTDVPLCRWFLGAARVVRRPSDLLINCTLFFCPLL